MKPRKPRNTDDLYLYKELDSSGEPQFHVSIWSSDYDFDRGHDKKAVLKRLKRDAKWLTKIAEYIEGQLK